jgi:dephospho-CoA kinase
MTAVILGFAGAIGSGKSTISSAVADTCGLSRVSFGDYVREQTKERGLDATAREALQAVGESLISEGWVPFCKSVLATARWTRNQSLVIDGIRHVEAVETLRMLVAPTPFRLIFLLTNEEIRHARLLERGIVYGEKQRQVEAHPTERELPTLLASVADYCIHADGTKDEVIARILARLREDALDI